MPMVRMQAASAIALGLLLAATGAWACVSGYAWGFIGMNLMCASMNVALGITGVGAAIRGDGRGFNGVAGAFNCGFGALGFVPSLQSDHAGFLGGDSSLMSAQLLVGALGIAVYFLGVEE